MFEQRPESLKPDIPRSRSLADASSLDTWASPSLLRSFVADSEPRPIFRRSTRPVIPPERAKASSSDPDLDSIDFSRYIVPGGAPNLASVRQILSQAMIAFRRNLDSLLLSSSQLMEEIAEFSDHFRLLPMHEREFNRMTAVRWILAQTTQMKADRHFMKITQSEIRALAAFQEFIDSQPPSAHIDIDPFFADGLFRTPDKVRRLLNTGVRLRRFVRPLVKNKPSPSDREALLRSPAERTGRILERFRQSIDEMTAADIEVIVEALARIPKDAPFARAVLFNLSWEAFVFPFAEVRPMELPRIFDLTPAVFNPPLLPAGFLETPFSMLNAGEWPLRAVSLALFDFLIETDPFVIADMFWKWFNDVAAVGQQLGIAAGEEVELGFDAMFPYFLVAIFAFGVAEILEVFTFCGAFLDYETEPHRQFAMTHCLGIVAYIARLDADALHARHPSGGH
jgi:hypothetical protein